MYQEKKSTSSLIFFTLLFPIMNITFNMIFIPLFSIIQLLVDKTFNIERLGLSIQGMLYFGLIYFNYHLAKTPAESADNLFERFAPSVKNLLIYLLVSIQYISIAIGINFLVTRQALYMYDIQLVQVLVPSLSIALVATNRFIADLNKKQRGY
ncbi:hypothetical protein [Pedobacter suwonensis]|uniref:hypothetical protein n=1 Tax=Pedobacter suwonensis TaxID=332999 RepID=UPI0011A7AC9F|nr:hypothetical protein [Pedobacter suwonensis]